MQDYIRAFIAVEINDAIRAGLADVQSILKEANGHVSWVKPQNIHSTLLFLGDLFSDSVSAAANALVQAASACRPLEIEISGIGYFGSPRSPRIIWAGIAGQADELIKLQGKIFAAVLQSGLKPDLKSFNPHLTIGRVRSNRNAADLLRALEENKNKAFGKLTVQRIVLMQSRLTAKGPEYTLLYAAAFDG